MFFNLLWQSALYGVIARIQALITLAWEHLSPGATVSSITNYAALTDPASYSPEPDAVEIQVNGVAQQGTYVLAADDGVVLVATKAGLPDFTYIIDGRVGAANLFLSSEGDRIITADGFTLSHSGV